MKRLILLLLLLVVSMSAGWPRKNPPIIGEGLRARLFGVRTGATLNPWRPTLTASVDKSVIHLGESFTVTYSTEYATSVQRDATHWGWVVGQSDGIILPLSGSYTLTPTEVGEFTTTIRAFRRNRDLNFDERADGGRRSATKRLAVQVTPVPGPVPPTPVPPEPVPPTPPVPPVPPVPPTPPTPPTPTPGFSLSAVGIGSAFGIDDPLSAASRDHELGAFLESQNGSWLLVSDEIMATAHPAAFDAWAKLVASSGKAKPAVVWHNAGRVLAIEEVAGKTAADLLAMAKAQTFSDNKSVVIRGKLRLLGLKPPPAGFRSALPSVTKILTPLAAEDCPSVDLSSQVLYQKAQVGGTCVLNTFAGACESAVYVAYGRANCREFSPSFLANLVDGWDGCYAYQAANAVQKYGNLPMSMMGPNTTRYPSGWQAIAAENKVLAVYGPPDRDYQGYLRAALHRGYIVCAGIGVGSGFDPDSNGYISYSRGGSSSINHEIRVIGWNQQERWYEIENSWGNWGIGGRGRARLDPRFFDFDNDLWVVVALAAAPEYKFPVPSAN